MIIRGAKVYTEEGIFKEKEVCIQGENFTETGEDGETIIDGSGCYLIPGLTDIHFHGKVYSYNDLLAYRKIS